MRLDLGSTQVGTDTLSANRTLLDTIYMINMQIELYVVRKIWNNKWAVINTHTGIAHTVWTDLIRARLVALDLNRALRGRYVA